MQSQFSREVRLGLVMCGGVSLAVYENGVAQELFRAVKGEGVYGALKRLVDSEIYVDILSGTSAGGINAILLGYALANNKDFRATGDLWRQKAGVLALLRKAGVAALVEEALAALPAYEGEEYGSELDLFITGTDLRGRVATIFDDQGHPISVKDHRALFVLCYRGERKNEFDPAHTRALAKLARITSCFPGVFTPVHVGSASPADRMLRRWGQFAHEAYFMDGGVLDNKPLAAVIDAISTRTAERDVDRLLLYVEPDPERFREAPRTGRPGVLEAAAAALLRIPRYQSIARDLQAIASHNRRAAQSPAAEYRQRRLKVTIAAIQRRLCSGASADLYRDLRHRLNHQFELLEMIQFANATASPVSLPDAGVRDWSGVGETERRKEEQSQRQQFMDALRSRAGQARGESLLEATDRQERAILRRLPPGDPVRAAYGRFRASPVPLDLDPIRTVRLSPLDAQRAYSAGTVAEKLYGVRFRHFGAFLKKSWRAHDLLQGRLDAACQLIECLATGRVPSDSVDRLVRSAQLEILSNAVGQVPDLPSPPVRAGRIPAPL